MTIRTAPTLETDRTVLRPHRLEDFDAYAAMWADPAVVRFIGGRAFTVEQCWQRLLRHCGMWSMIGYGFWAIEDKDGGQFIGEAGFHDLKRLIEPSIAGVPEAGWALVPDRQGRGLATEVMSRIMAWGDAAFGTARTVCIIDPDNAGSLKVAAKLGYRSCARTSYHGQPTLLLERFGPA